MSAEDRVDGGADALTCTGVAVGYQGAPVLADLDLAVRPGEVVALLGPSGSGKSTLLHTVAGFLPLIAGELRLAGRTVDSGRRSSPPETRNIGMVFQNYALWPHLSVIDTVAYPRRRRGVATREARADAQAILERLDIAHLADRRPAQLSGGEQQRVGLARALARDAALYLFDEPTAHLDTHLRATFQLELGAKQRATGAGALYATHDAAEALGLADRVALVGAGRLVQLGAPADVYARPVNLWAARLTGPASVLTAVVTPTAYDTVKLRVAGIEIRVAGAEGGSVSGLAGERQILLRPDWTSAGGPLSGRLTAVAFRGPHTDHLVEVGLDQVLVRRPGPPRHRVGDLFSWSIDRAWVLPDSAPASA
jgi:iron(III) transport system ATP-binding protein